MSVWQQPAAIRALNQVVRKDPLDPLVSYPHVLSSQRPVKLRLDVTVINSSLQSTCLGGNPVSTRHLWSEVGVWGLL